MDEQLQAWVERDCKRRASNCAERLKETCPVDTGALRASIEARDNEVLALGYAIPVDKHQPFIKAAALK